MVHPRGTRVFFGVWDRSAPPIGMAERFMAHMPAARDALPDGDFRDWPAIDAWAAEIAAELQAAGSMETVGAASRLPRKPVQHGAGSRSRLLRSRVLT